MINMWCQQQQRLTVSTPTGDGGGQRGMEGGTRRSKEGKEKQLRRRMETIK